MTKSRRIRQNKKSTRKSFRNFMKGSRKMVMNPLKNNRFTRKMFGGQGNTFAPPAFVVALIRDKTSGKYTVLNNGIAYVNRPIESGDLETIKDAKIINGNSDSGKYVANPKTEETIKGLHSLDKFGNLFPMEISDIPEVQAEAAVAEAAAAEAAAAEAAAAEAASPKLPPPPPKLARPSDVTYIKEHKD